MTTKHQNVVVAFDFSPQGPAVLARAIALVSRAPFHVLHFVTVIDPHLGIAALPRSEPVDYRYADRVRDLMSEEIKKAFGATPISDEIHFFVHARIGKPAQEILDLSKELGADLILIGTHGFTGVERLIMGSTAERVVREAGCPVLVVRPKIYPDVELTPVTKVEDHVLHRSTPRRFSYQNNSVTMRPPEWPIG
jgi:nucleotide-binding universal stress UspA family protein